MNYNVLQSSRPLWELMTRLSMLFAHVLMLPCSIIWYTGRCAVTLCSSAGNRDYCGSSQVIIPDIAHNAIRSRVRLCFCLFVSARSINQKVVDGFKMDEVYHS